MSDHVDDAELVRTRATERRGRWPGLVWAVPLAALLIVSYLGLRAFAERGVTVVVTFASAAGARVGDTQVVYKGVTVGHVVRITISPDGKHVDMVLRLTPRAKPVLRDTTKFWLVGAQPTLTDFSSLKAAVSGVTIGISPGVGEPRRHFIGLEQPPPIPPDTPGTLYVLHGEHIGETRPGSGVFYHGLEVGRVSTIAIDGPQKFKLVIFIQAPDDQLVRPDTRFFLANAVNISLSGSSFSAELGPGNSAIAGGIEFDTPEAAASEPHSVMNAQFDYYDDFTQAADAPRGPFVLYDAVFPGGGGQLRAKAPVKLAGFPVGEVLESHLRIVDGAPQSNVVLEIEPLKLLDGMTPPANEDWRKPTDAAIASLIARGYRLSMTQEPPLVGPASLALGRSPTSKPGTIVYAGAHPVLPTTAATDISALTDRAATLLDKVNAVPIAEIGQDVRQITSKLGKLVASPQVSDSLNHLDSTLTSIDQTLKQVQPQVGPLIAKLNLAADQIQATAASADHVLSGVGARGDANLPDAIHELTDAARSIRTLADYLDRHPEAVIRGKVKDAK